MAYGFNDDKSKATMLRLIETDYSYGNETHDQLSAVLTTTPAYKYPKLRVINRKKETWMRNNPDYTYVFELMKHDRAQRQGSPKDTIERHALYRCDSTTTAIVIDATSYQYSNESEPYSSSLTVKQINADGTTTTLTDWLESNDKKVYLAMFEDGQHI